MAVVLALTGALIAGLAVELRHAASRPGATGPATAAERADTGPALAGLRERADLPPCLAGSNGPAQQGPAALRGVIVECAANGAPVDAARVLAGQQAGQVVLNLWAYWCVPCRAELPAMAEYQRRAGPGVRVVTVHQDADQAAALALLAELDVRLPTLQDGQRRIAAALGVPNVMPATVVLTTDGSVARILPQAFTNPGEIAAAVGGPRQ